MQPCMRPASWIYLAVFDTWRMLARGKANAGAARFKASISIRGSLARHCVGCCVARREGLPRLLCGDGCRGSRLCDALFS